MFTGPTSIQVNKAANTRVQAKWTTMRRPPIRQTRAAYRAAGRNPPGPSPPPGNRSGPAGGAPHRPTTARNEQEMRRMFDDSWAGGIDIFDTGKLVAEAFIGGGGRFRVPPRVGREPAVEQVEPAQDLDLEMLGEAALQLRRGKEVDVQREAPAI